MPRINPTRVVVAAIIWVILCVPVFGMLYEAHEANAHGRSDTSALWGVGVFAYVVIVFAIIGVIGTIKSMF